MKILLLSAYHAASHERWAAGLMANFPDCQWTCLSLPPRHFNWRIRGNSLTWALKERETLSQHYDLVLATSMVDLSALRGFIPSLACIPTLLYFHENQFAYPASKQQFTSVEPQILSIYSAFCADRLLFNSEFNRRTFFSGARDLFKKLPDGVSPTDLDSLEAHSDVLSVPLEDKCYRASVASKVNTETTIELIWNHRWEYDKSPDRLLLALEKLPELPITVHVVGQQFRRQPEAFEKIEALLRRRGQLGSWGYVESESAYRELLCRCHGVISTALHDFQGLAVMEAVASGCIPVVPRRQAYPEWFGLDFCYASYPEDANKEAEALAARIEALVEGVLQGRRGPAPDMGVFRWQSLSEAYRQQFELVYHSARIL
ncbi:DUF3524 domain-containing protein [Maricurvus nonylphenolicus]|uniref:tRNA-queuosine alpha-mannosyltransferase domain-containing protein n=1 Tax=Maricurvus nonylphenolicus TaxID=1008307 RepID=UPI0036F1D3A2